MSIQLGYRSVIILSYILPYKFVGGSIQCDAIFDEGYMLPFVFLITWPEACQDMVNTVGQVICMIQKLNLLDMCL